MAAFGSATGAGAAAAASAAAGVPFTGSGVNSLRARTTAPGQFALTSIDDRCPSLSASSRAKESR